jgi:hypothetical protein
LTNDVRNLFEKRNVLPVTKLVELLCRYWRVEDIFVVVALIHQNDTNPATEKADTEEFSIICNLL